jgi:hypothetical protein
MNPRQLTNISTHSGALKSSGQKQPTNFGTNLSHDSYIDKSGEDDFSEGELCDVDEGVDNHHNERTLGNQVFSADISSKPKGEKQVFESGPVMKPMAIPVGGANLPSEPKKPEKKTQ